MTELAPDAFGQAAARETCPDLDLTQPETQAIYAYWLTIRAGRAMPAPRDVKPAEIRALLPHLSIVEVIEGPPADYLYRIDGEAVRESLGFSRTGRRLSELREKLGPAHDWLSTCYARIRADRMPRCVRQPLRHINRSFHVLEAVLLPLSEDGYAVHRILQGVSAVARPEVP